MKTWSRAALAPFAVVSVLTLAQSAQAFSPFGEYEDPEVHYKIYNPGFNDPLAGSIAVQNQAITDAASRWSNAGSQFRFVFDGLSDFGKMKPGDGVNIVQVRDASQTGTLALTRANTSTGEQDGFDIIFFDGAPVVGVSSGGTVLTGGAVTTGPLLGGTFPDTVLAAVDRFGDGPDYWRVRIGAGCPGGTCKWSTTTGVPSNGTTLTTAGVGMGDFDGDGSSDDIVLSAIDSNGGADYWRLTFGTNCTATGCTYGNLFTVASGGSALAGGGIAVAQLDADPRSDIVIAAIDQAPDQADYWRYTVGMNCGPSVPTGCTSFSPIRTASTDGSIVNGGGVVFADVDGNGVKEIVLSGIDNYGDGADYWRVRILHDCNFLPGDPAFGACGIGPVIGITSGGSVLNGTGIAAGNLDTDPAEELVVSAIDVNPSGRDYWRYRMLDACSPSTWRCTLSPGQSAQADGTVMEGGGVALNDFDNDGTEDLLLAGVDIFADGPDYWRIRQHTSCGVNGVCIEGINWSTTGAPGTFDIATTAGHELGHAAGLDHSDIGGSIMICASNGPPARDLSCDDVQGIQQLYASGSSSAAPNQASTVQAVQTGGSVVKAPAITGTMQAGQAVLIAAGIDNFEDGADYWRLAFGTGCAGGTCAWGGPVAVPSDGSVLGDAGVVAGDIDANGAFDVIISATDTPEDSPAYTRYRLGHDCTTAGACTWGPVQTVTYGVDPIIPSGIAMADFVPSAMGAAPAPEIVFAGHYNTDWYFRIGINCQINAGAIACDSFTSTQSATSGGPVLIGSSAAFGDLDGDGTTELVLASAIANTGKWAYKIMGCDQNGCGVNSPVREVSATMDMPRALCNAPQTLNYFNNSPTELWGTGMTVAQTSTGPQIWLNAGQVVTEGRGLQMWRYGVLKNCTTTGGEWNCQLSTRNRSAVVAASTGGHIVDGAAIAAVDLDVSGNPEVVLAGLDQYGDGPDYWRIRVGLDSQQCGF